MHGAAKTTSIITIKGLADCMSKQFTYQVIKAVTPQAIKYQNQRIFQ